MARLKPTGSPDPSSIRQVGSIEEPQPPGAKPEAKARLKWAFGPTQLKQLEAQTPELAQLTLTNSAAVIDQVSLRLNARGIDKGGASAVRQGIKALEQALNPETFSLAGDSEGLKESMVRLRETLTPYLGETGDVTHLTALLDAGLVSTTGVRSLRTNSVDAQLNVLESMIPGFHREQGRAVLKGAHSRGSSAVFGGSRIRGNHHEGSDLDVGFGSLSKSQAGKVLKSGRRVEGGLQLEETLIVPGNVTPAIPEMGSPEEFFQRSGIRAERDPRAGERYFASGSITVNEGSIVLVPPPEADHADPS